MIKKSIGRLGAALIVAAVGVGLLALPAVAEEPLPPAPDGVAESEWFSVLEDAKAEFGDGDKAELEALQQVAPLAVEYCTTFYSHGSGNGVWYKIPLKTGGGTNCVMEMGNNSTAVRALQETLVRCYGRSLTLDGSFGPATYNALMYAQSSAGIAVDGVYGTNTRKNIKWWGGGSICTKGSSLGL
jgi:peptidoglycan hydrolase-like protein with peptidoglycan-binding domain